MANLFLKYLRISINSIEIVILLLAKIKYALTLNRFLSTGFPTMILSITEIKDRFINISSYSMRFNIIKLYVKLGYVCNGKQMTYRETYWAKLMSIF